MGQVIALEDERVLIWAHSQIVHSGLPNAWGCRIPVYSKLNVSFFCSLLGNYWDSNLCDSIEFGFPIGLVKPVAVKAQKNHKGALDYPTEIDRYLKKEKSYGAILGPLSEPPFVSFSVSPLNSVPKKDSLE